MKPGGKLFYGWVVVVISLFIMTMAYAIYFAWPVFYVPILNEFGWSRAVTALIFSAASTVYALSSPISGFLFDKLGPRRLFTIAAIVIAIGAAGCYQATEIWHFFISFGFFIAFGAISAGYIPNLALVSNWFEKKRATALGISQIGLRDSFILVPLIQLLILAVGWRYSFLVLAAATAVIMIPLSLFLRARPQDMGLLPDGEPVPAKKSEKEPSEEDDRIVDKKWVTTDWTLPMALKRYQFWALFAILLAFGFTFTSLINHFVVFMTDIGFTALFAANLLLIYAITTMIGRLLGFISDRAGREKACTLGAALMLLPLPILLITKDTSAPWMLYLFVVCFGVGNGVYGVSLAAGAADLFQGKRFGTIYGAANTGYGLGAAFGTWLYGYIFDVTGTYTLAIVITMLAVCIKGISIWVAAPRQVRRVSGLSRR